MLSALAARVSLGLKSIGYTIYLDDNSVCHLMRNSIVILNQEVLGSHVSSRTFKFKSRTREPNLVN
jgi:hypothetical protein